TTLRRLIVHNSIKAEMINRLTTIYSRLKIGDPTQDGVLVGPLIDEHAFNAMQNALGAIAQQGGRVIGGERVYPEMQGQGARGKGQENARGGADSPSSSLAPRPSPRAPSSFSVNPAIVHTSK